MASGMKGANLGHLVTSGLLNPKEHGYSNRTKGDFGGVLRPNASKSRFWQTKLMSAFNTLESMGNGAETFEGRLLEAREMLGIGEPALRKDGKVKKVKPFPKMIADAETRVKRMEDKLRTAKDGIKRAKNSAILPEDKTDVEIAEGALIVLEEKVNGFAFYIADLKREYGLDSTL